MVPVYPQRMLVHAQPQQQPDKSQSIGHQRCHGRAFDAHGGHGPPAKDQQRVEHHIQNHHQQQKPERRARVPGAAQHGRDEGEQKHQRHGQKNDLQIGFGQVQRFVRCAHPLHELARKRHAKRCDQDGDDCKKRSTAAKNTLGFIEFFGTHGLGNQNIRRHADAKHGADQRKHHVIGVGRGRQRRFTQAPPHPHGIDRAVERLQHIARQNGQGKHQQRGNDGALGQVLCGGLRSGHPAILRHCGQSALREISAY